MSQDDPFLALGLTSDATEAEIRRAWRQAARHAHPDVGGSTEEMLRLNDAALRAITHIKTHKNREAPPSTTSRESRRQSGHHSYVVSDYSSFTIDRLPVDAWHLLEIAAAQCGPVVEDTPPYVMEFLLHDSPFPDLVASVGRCELVPEAGGTTVHISVFEVAKNSDAATRLRDFLVDGINHIADND